MESNGRSDKPPLPIPQDDEGGLHALRRIDDHGVLPGP